MKNYLYWEHTLNHVSRVPYVVNDVSFELDPVTMNYYLYVTFIIKGNLYTFRHIHEFNNEQSTLQIVNTFREHVEYINEHGRVPIRIDD